MLYMIVTFSQLPWMLFQEIQLILFWDLSTWFKICDIMLLQHKYELKYMHLLVKQKKTSYSYNATTLHDAINILGAWHIHMPTNTKDKQMCWDNKHQTFVTKDNAAGGRIFYFHYELHNNQQTMHLYGWSYQKVYKPACKVLSHIFPCNINYHSAHYLITWYFCTTHTNCHHDILSTVAVYISQHCGMFTLMFIRPQLS